MAAIAYFRNIQTERTGLGGNDFNRTFRRSPEWLRGKSVLLAVVVTGLLLGSPAAGAEKAESDGNVGQAETAESRRTRILSESHFDGGLVVQVGLRDPDHALRWTEPSNTTSNTLVDVLVRDREALRRVRRQLREAGVYGRVTARFWNGGRLPYADGMVNLLRVLDKKIKLPEDEIDRVLAPGGTAWTPRGKRLISYQKAWPEDVDQWSHSRYDATGNAVSSDKRVGPPQFIQWEAWPRWNRGVKTSCLVSARGRIFYILDDSHFASTARTWSLIARDAFNGIQLWRHELPSWEGARGGKKVGPAQVHRRLVARGDRVYATLGEDVPVSVLDAATGKVVRVLDQTGGTEEFILSDGVLVALTNTYTDAEIRRGEEQETGLVAVDPETGRMLWEREADRILPLTMAADGKQVVYHDGRVIRSLDLFTGAEKWTSSPTGQDIVTRSRANPDSPGAEESTIILAPQFAPTLIIYEDVVAFAGGCQLNVFSAMDGHELWRSEYAASNYSVPVDLFGFGGSLWGPDRKMNMWRPLDDNLDVNAYDPLTGSMENRVEGDYGFRFQHHRCHQMKVVDNKVVAARAGIEFLDTETGELVGHHWVRGSCYYGILPANGLLYVPPHNCACYVRAKLSGFMALKSSETPPRALKIRDDERLQRNTADGTIGDADGKIMPGDWPTYRHDMGRSGCAGTAVGTDLLLGWQADLGQGLTSPVVAGGRAYVASREAHQLQALDTSSGEVVWKVGFNARIDSPPTVHEGLVLCGCRDGTVHALRAADGQRVWRFRASPGQRLIVSRGQLESAWPVHGSLLVVDGTAYFAAGKSSYLDGGIHLYGLDVKTGRKQIDQVLWSRHPDGSERIDEQSVDGYLNDVLSSDGERIFMRHQILNLAGRPQPGRVAHLHSPDGFLSSDTTTRLLWTYAPLYTSPHQGAFYDLRLSRALFPSGRILVEDRKTIYGFGQNHYERMRVQPGGTWALFAARKENDVPLDLSAREYRKLALSGEKSVNFRWWKRIPIHVRALTKTENVLFAAGPRGRGLASQAALDGRAEAILLAVSPEDGEILGEMSLPSTPVWDGMAAARGNLYLTLANGQMLCLWDADSGRPGTSLSAAGWGVDLPPVKVAAEPDLLGRWRFDEGEGRLARDCSGRGHHADVTGRWAQEDGETCLVTEGVSRAAVIPDSPHLHFGNDDFSLALWVKVDNHDVRLLGKEDFPENWWVINLPKDGRAELVLGEGRGPKQSVRAKTSVALPTDVWNHLVAVVDREAGEVRWFVNGSLDSRHPIAKTMSEGLHAAGSDIAIPSEYKPFRGRVSDFRVYGCAVEGRRVREMYRNTADNYTSSNGDGQK